MRRRGVGLAEAIHFWEPLPLLSLKEAKLVRTGEWNLKGTAVYEGTQVADSRDVPVDAATQYEIRAAQRWRVR